MRNTIPKERGFMAPYIAVAAELNRLDCRTRIDLGTLNEPALRFCVARAVAGNYVCALRGERWRWGSLTLDQV